MLITTQILPYVTQNKGGSSILVFVTFFLVPLFFTGSYAETIHYQDPPSLRMNLLVIDTIPNYTPYGEFCKRNPGECNLTGPGVIELSSEIKGAIRRINSTVNREVQFALDIDQYETEEYWTYPRSGRGDCEDKALEKRSRLVESGMPRSTMRVATVFHKKFFNSHCLLTIETNEGTYVLDSISDSVMIWHEAPYNYEMRERANGEWERFDQGIWSH